MTSKGQLQPSAFWPKILLCVALIVSLMWMATYHGVPYPWRLLASVGAIAVSLLAARWALRIIVSTREK
jgi:hypothetical protein